VSAAAPGRQPGGQEQAATPAHLDRSTLPRAAGVGDYFVDDLDAPADISGVGTASRSSITQETKTFC